MSKLKADLHIHSCFSDGEPNPLEIVKRSLELGMNAISITDHDNFRGSIEAKKVIQEKRINISLIVGSEVRTDRGDVLVYCEDPLEFKSGVELEVLVDSVKENGCLAVPAHPFDRVRSGIGIEGLSLIANKISAVECFNAFSSRSSNAKAEDYARRSGLHCLANSDAHTLRAIGSYFNSIEIDPPMTFDSLRKAVEGGMIEAVTPPISPFLYFDKARWSLERRMMKRRSC